MSNSNDFLQEYLDSLLNDTALGGANSVADEQALVNEGALKLASGSNIAPLTSASRSARTAAPVRPFAEPIRTLNLRMPLPSVAEPATATPVIEAKASTDIKPLETVQRVDVKTATESKTLVETEALVETKALVETAPVETKSVETKSLETKPIETKPLETNSVDVESRVDTQERIPKVEQQPASAPLQKGSTDLAAMAPPLAWLPNGRPQWAQQPFECLIFKAGGLQLAAPLVELGSIYPLDKDALTEIFGQTQWFMGLLPIKEYNVRTMDTGLVVMPERYNAAMREEYRYVVSLFGSDWGLAVDSVVGTTVLDPDRVRWRGERNKRPWLAGTLIDQMCALFDISQLAWLFHNQDRKRAPR